MTSKFWVILMLIGSGAVVSGCVPMVVGAGGAVIADEVMEQEGGGDGLF